MVTPQGRRLCRDRGSGQAGAPRAKCTRATISSTLYAATDSSEDGAKLPDTIVKQIVEMFSTNIDFRGDLKRGDHFNVVYETFWQDGEFVRSGPHPGGRVHQPRHQPTSQSGSKIRASKQGGGYYSFDGKSLEKSLPQVAS